MALGASNLATKTLMWVPLMYLLPLVAALAAFWLLTGRRLPFLGGGRAPGAALPG
jgi:hypothetical protein